jgi:KDO2-lipid IV(A) lauroyltransferase
VVLRNLERAFGNGLTPQERVRLAKETYRNGIRTVVDGFASLARGGPARLTGAVRVEGLERLEGALKAGKGAIGVTAHYGPFPFIGAFLPSRGFPFYFLYRRPRNRVVAERFDGWIRRVNCGIIEDAPRLAAVRRCLRALRDGACLGILIDQHYAAGVEVPFFGHPAKTGVGAAVLSARSGAPLVPMRIRHDPNVRGGFILAVEEPVPPPADTSEETLRACMALLTSRVEAWLREDPAQWYWMHRRWKDLDRAEDAG